MEEIFKDLKDYSRYEFSNLGRIRNKKSGKFLTNTVVTKGYLSVNIYRDSLGRSITVKTHRLIAECFIGKKEGLVIDHIDNDKTNNRLENLEYVSNRFNVLKQKIYSAKGFPRFDLKSKKFIIEYRKDNSKFKFTSFNREECLNYYLENVKETDSSIIKLISICLANTEVTKCIAKGHLAP
jgi:hypothetical protein